jgi:hypothetical protein
MAGSPSFPFVWALPPHTRTLIPTKSDRNQKGGKARKSDSPVTLLFALHRPVVAEVRFMLDGDGEVDIVKRGVPASSDRSSETRPQFAGEAHGGGGHSGRLDF